MIATLVSFTAASFLAAVLRDLASRRWGKLRHIDCLRQLVNAAGVFDPWDMRCENCGRPMRGSNLYAAVVGRVAPDGTAVVTGTAVWHRDRPACAAAMASDPRAREMYAAQEEL